MPRKWYKANIISSTLIGEKTKHFKLAIQDENAFSHKAGQFITCDLPIGDKRLDRWRSYSIASAPNMKNELDLCIVKLPNGRASTYFLDEIKVGDEITFKGPEGQFVLPEKIEHDLIFICTGTGVAPFRAMIQQIKDNGGTDHKVHLIFGTRFLRDVLYREEFEILANNTDWFNYTIVLSREENWNGRKGYVHQVYKELYGDTSPNRLFYLCGWSQMVDQAAAILKDEMNYPSTQVRLELYG
jgi:CDP-4-dehydro-6-deoxyglucose reductase